MGRPAGCETCAGYFAEGGGLEEFGEDEDGDGVGGQGEVG